MPKAHFEMDDYQNQVPVTINFKNLSTQALNYQWSFGNGDTSFVENPQTRYLQSGFHVISLKASKGNKQSVSSKRIFLKAPEKCLVDIETNYGIMTFELFNETPIHRDNFLQLVSEDYYEGIKFHRVIRGFVIQAGDEKTKSLGNSQMARSEKTLDSEIDKDLYHTKGALAMARQPDQVNPKKKSSSTQFYIVHGSSVSANTLENYEIEKDKPYPNEIKKKYKNLGGSPQLDQEYTIFGHLIEGFEVLDKIANVSTDNSDKPLEDIKIIRVTEIN